MTEKKKKGVSIRPTAFSNSFLLLKSQEYEIPADEERRSRMSVSGFPSKLLGVINYSLPGRLGGKWNKSISNVERFLLSVGIPLLNKSVEGCSRYSELMCAALDADDDRQQNYLSSLRFLYAVEDMRITGGREITTGGTPIRCLDRDTQILKDIQVKLGDKGVSQSALVVLSVAWALSTDNDCQVVSVPIQGMCSRIVKQFTEKVAKWEEELGQVA